MEDVSTMWNEHLVISHEIYDLGLETDDGAYAYEPSRPNILIDLVVWCLCFKYRFSYLHCMGQYGWSTYR